jgi:hypothetical protein
MRRIVWAIVLSVSFHIIMPLIEAALGFDRKSIKAFDSVVSWPAWLCSVLVPPGHGIPQLVFPFFFSVAFYSVLFWLLIALYEWLHREHMSRAQG